MNEQVNAHGLVYLCEGQFCSCPSLAQKLTEAPYELWDKIRAFLPVFEAIHVLFQT